MRTRRPKQERTKEALKAAFVYLSARNATNFSKLSRAIEGAATGRHLAGVAADAKKGGRNMSGELARIIAPKFHLTYEQMLGLGELILSGTPGDEALERVQELGGGVKAGKMAVSQVAVASGHGSRAVNNALSSISVDDVTRETVQHVLERMSAQNLDARIAMRSRIKAAIKGVETKMGLRSVLDVSRKKPSD